MNFIPVILCGGSGSRLFPLSRNTYPKQFVKISNDYSLLQNTILRFTSCSHIVLVSNSMHKNIILAQIKELIDLKLLPSENKFTIFLEPVGRNTLPAITIVSEHFINKKLLFVPCDHVYDTECLLKSIEKGLNSSANIVTFGIKPTYPETGFGYIESDPVDGFVVKFIEKPNLEKASELIKSDNIYWNSGIFLLESKNFINLVYSLRENLLNTIKNLNNSSINDYDSIVIIEIDSKYSNCDNISVDYGIMELLESKQIFMCEYNGEWNDIGSFKSIHDISQKDDSNINLDANILNVDSSNCLVKSNKLVLLNNVNNLSIIDTHDSILISDMSKSQDVKKLFEMAKNLNKNEISYTHFEYRPWGYFEVLAGGDNMGFKIKKIIVNPNKRLSLQSHEHRKEYWFCIRGVGQAQVDSNFINLELNSMCFIDTTQTHRLINNSDTNLEIIEVQLGLYLGEDDIIRYEDDFNRK